MEHKIAISHAGGIAAEAILEKFVDSGIAPASLVLLDDESRIGSKLPYAGTHLSVLNQREFNYSACSLLLLLQADDEIERQAIADGCFVVGHEIQAEGAPMFLARAGEQPELGYAANRLRLAGPELCCLLPVLIELDRIGGILGLNMTFLRSAEFHGKAGVDELATQSINLFNARDAKPVVFEQQIAFNLLPSTSDSQFCRDLDELIGNSACSAVQQTIDVPVFHGFAAALQIRFKAEMSLQAAKKTLSAVDNVIVKNKSVSTISDCNQSFSCVISQLEQAPNQPSGLQFWMITDPMRYGLANNYMNVTEFLLKSFL